MDFFGDTVRVFDKSTFTIAAPAGETVEIDAVTLGKAGGTECNLGVKDTAVRDSSRTETEAIAKDSGGEIKGPWTVDDRHGLLVENNGNSAIVCGYRGKELPP